MLLAAALILPALILVMPLRALGDEAMRAEVATFVQPTHEARQQAMTAHLDRMGLSYRTEAFQPARPGVAEGRNIIVDLATGAPADAPVIVLSAHYDAARDRQGRFFDGVVDNAASAVILSHVASDIEARALAHPYRHRIRVIFFDHEELGLLGARHHVESAGVADVAFVLNSDVAAYGDTLMYSEHASFPQVRRAVLMACAELALTCIGYPAYPPSDDRVFTAAGVPNTSLGFQPRVAAHQLWLALNGGTDSGLRAGFVPPVFNAIHSPQDTMDAVDAETLSTARAVYGAIVRHLDQLPLAH
jgi:Zn-dependent M28 family amino/carboxypeptidase